MEHLVVLNIMFDWSILPKCFYRATQLCYRGLGSRNSVRPSVCPSAYTRALWQNETMHCRYFATARKDNHSSFLTPTVVGGAPSVWNLRSKWPTPFEKRQLRQISAYNIWTVRYSKKCSIMTNMKSTMGFPMGYRWSAYVTLTSPKGWLKKRFSFFE